MTLFVKFRQGYTVGSGLSVLVIRGLGVQGFGRAGSDHEADSVSARAFDERAGKRRHSCATAFDGLLIFERFMGKPFTSAVVH